MRSPRQTKTRLPSVTLTKLADGFGLQSNPKLSLFYGDSYSPQRILTGPPFSKAA